MPRAGTLRGGVRRAQACGRLTSGFACLARADVVTERHRDGKRRDGKTLACKEGGRTAVSEARGTALFLSHDVSRSGAPLMLLNFLRWFRRTHDMRLRILAGKSGDLLPEFAELGEVDCFEAEPSFAYRALHALNLYPTQASRGQIASHLAVLRQTLIGCDIRLIYANSVASARMVQFLSFLDCPVICHVHELDVSIRALQAPGLDIIGLLKARTSRYIAVSDAVKANLVDRHGVPASKIDVVLGLGPPPADHGVESFQPRDIRHELAIPAEARIVCGCGSIEPRKGTDLFLDVAVHAAASRRGPAVHFVWVGGRSREVDLMRRQAASLGLSGVVHFVGQTADVAPYFEASELVLLTSREESLSLVMLEAALRCKPIICFEGSGHPPEFVRDGNGLAIAGFDPRKMAETLMEALADSELCRRMGESARQKVTDRYDFNRGANRIAEIIEDTLQFRTSATDGVKVSAKGECRNDSLGV